MEPSDPTAILLSSTEKSAILPMSGDIVQPIIDAGTV
jgi:hypothetical protein